MLFCPVVVTVMGLGVADIELLTDEMQDEEVQDTWQAFSTT